MADVTVTCYPYECAFVISESSHGALSWQNPLTKSWEKWDLGIKWSKIPLEHPHCDAVSMATFVDPCLSKTKFRSSSSLRASPTYNTVQWFDWFSRDILSEFLIKYPWLTCIVLHACWSWLLQYATVVWIWIFMRMLLLHIVVTWELHLSLYQFAIYSKQCPSGIKIIKTAPSGHYSLFIGAQVQMQYSISICYYCV